MSPAAFFDALERQPAGTILLQEGSDGDASTSLLDGVTQAREMLGSARVLAVLADNSATWVHADLAALQAGIVHVPLPGFFTDRQIGHALHSACVDTVWTDQPRRVLSLDAGFVPDGVFGGLACLRRRCEQPSLPAGTGKISFTSGTTAEPRGACLDARGLLDTADAVREAMQVLDLRRHLAVLPLSLLLENVAGLYAPLLSGCAVVVQPLEVIGWRGMSGFDPTALHRVVVDGDIHSVILVPELLKAWVVWLRGVAGRAPDSLRYLAVGGAKVPQALIEQARSFGLDAYQGYGMTECGSVVSLNRPGDDGPDAGRPLSHLSVGIRDGEVVVQGAPLLGYAGGREATESRAQLPTGDLGHLDERGHLHIEGRRSNLLVTGYGRNVSPEWVESCLLAQPEIAQALVLGEALPGLGALLVPSPQLTSPDLHTAVQRTNACLPDYARVLAWRVVQPFTPQSGLATGNGRPRRSAIALHHAETIADLHAQLEKPTMFHDELAAQCVEPRAYLLAAPIVRDALQGVATRENYIAFLTQAYHHVRHTVPLLMLMGARLPERLAWMREHVAEYIDEERGHDGWILNDILASGGDVEALAPPSPATEVMVAYAYDLVQRGNPAAFLGMVHVLEGTSVALALRAADSIQGATKLPDAAFSYLRSHGTIDQQHTRHLAELLERLDHPDRADVTHRARMFYRLYANIFHELPYGVAEATCN